MTEPGLKHSENMEFGEQTGEALEANLESFRRGR